MLTARVLTVSDRSSRGLRVDESGPAVERRLKELGFEVLGREVCEDGVESVGEALRRLCTDARAHLIVTTGGSGLSPRDLTPEATLEAGERLVPGLMELARSRCVSSITPLAALSRGVAVTRGSTLILNLPGHPKAAVETLDAIASLLPHALEILGATLADCEQTGREGAGKDASP